MYSIRAITGYGNTAGLRATCSCATIERENRQGLMHAKNIITTRG